MDYAVACDCVAGDPAGPPMTRTTSGRPRQPGAAARSRVASRRRIEKLRGMTRAPTGVRATLDLALLGIIAETPGASGYDISKIFDLSMSHFWHVHPTQIYPTLERMEELGIIKGRQVVQRGRPNKRRYTITPSGERLLVEWLASPFEGFKIKHPPLLRSRFLGNLGPDGARAILEEERTSWANQLKLYLDIEQEYFSDKQGYHNVDAMFSMFTLRRGIDWMVENIRWCDWAISEIERNRELFPPRSMKARLKPFAHHEEWEKSERARSSAPRSRARSAASAAPDAVAAPPAAAGDVPAATASATSVKSPRP